MGTESIFKSFLVLHRNFWECHHFKLGGVTALFSHMVGMNSLAATASHSHMGGARIQLWSSPSKVFFIINRKVILFACLRMFMETCDFYLQNSFLRVHANQTIEQVTDILLPYRHNLQSYIQLQQIFKVLQHSWKTPRWFILRRVGSSQKLLLKNRIDSLISKMALLKPHLEAEVGFFFFGLKNL